MSEFTFRPVRWSEFAEHFTAARRWSRVEENCAELDDVTQCIPYMAVDCLGGFAIHQPTKEIRYLHSVLYGRGDMLVQEAIKRGGTWLTCFDGYLTDLYQRHGFQITHREPNWEDNKPEVLTMRLQ